MDRFGVKTDPKCFLDASPESEDSRQIRKQEDRNCGGNYFDEVRGRSGGK